MTVNILEIHHGYIKDSKLYKEAFREWEKLYFDLDVCVKHQYYGFAVYNIWNHCCGGLYQQSFNLNVFQCSEQLVREIKLLYIFFLRE